MGTDTYSSAQFRIDDTPHGRTALAQAAERLADILEFDDVERHPGPDGDLQTVRHTLGHSLGLDTRTFGDGEVWASIDHGVIAIGASGEGRHRTLDQVTAILAAEHIDGDICCEDGKLPLAGTHRRRHSPEDDGDITYANDPVTDLWIVQM